jgi:hypothetical protein
MQRNKRIERLTRGLCPKPPPLLGKHGCAEIQQCLSTDASGMQPQADCCCQQNQLFTDMTRRLPPPLTSSATLDLDTILTSESEVKTTRGKQGCPALDQSLLTQRGQGSEGGFRNRHNENPSNPKCYQRGCFGCPTMHFHITAQLQGER